MPPFRPTHLSFQKLIFLLGIPLIFAPIVCFKLIRFLEHWERSKLFNDAFGSDIFIKLLYQVTSSVAVVALVGSILLLKMRDRRGLFLASFCLVPFMALNMASLLEMNAGTQYVLFILPAVFLATSYFCIYILDSTHVNRHLIAAALIAIVILPSLQSDYLYYTSYYGNRGRLKEAIHFLKKHRLEDDYFLPYAIHIKKTEFVFKHVAAIEGLDIANEKLLSTVPERFAADQRIWIVTFKRMPKNAKGFDKWLAEHTHIFAELKANWGPADYTVKVYLYAPDMTKTG